MRQLSILLLCWLYSIVAVGKDYPMIHYSQKDGLPSNMVYDVYQADDGYIWFATDKGIAKYNGLKFQRYTTKEGLSDNECFFFRKDYEGRLWIGTYNGTLMYYKDGIFHTAKNTPFLQLPIKDGITGNIRLESDSSLTIFFKNRLAIISVMHDKLSAYNLREINKQFNSVALLNIRKNGPLYFDLFYCWYKVTIDHNAQIIANVPYEKEMQLRIASFLPNQNYYITKAAIYTEDLDLYKVLPKDFVFQYNINKVYTEEKHCFVATNHGLWIDSIHILQQHNISNVNKDREGNYWITTLDDGVYKMSGAFLSSGFIAQAYPEKVKHVANYSTGLIITTTNRNTYRLDNDSMHTLFDYLQKNKQNLFREAYFGQILFQDQYWNVGSQTTGIHYDYILKGLDKPHPQINRIKLYEQHYKNNVREKYASIRDSLGPVNYIFVHDNYMYIIGVYYMTFMALNTASFVATRKACA